MLLLKTFIGSLTFLTASEKILLDSFIEGITSFRRTIYLLCLSQKQSISLCCTKIFFPNAYAFHQLNRYGISFLSLFVFILINIVNATANIVVNFRDHIFL